MEAKNALAEAAKALQQTESKLKAMEEDFNKNNQELEALRNQKAAKPQMSEAVCQTNSQTTGCDNSCSKQLSVLEQQVKSN